MLYILKDIRDRLEQIEIYIEELKEELSITNNAQRQETDD